MTHLLEYGKRILKNFHFENIKRLIAGKELTLTEKIEVTSQEEKR